MIVSSGESYDSMGKDNYVIMLLTDKLASCYPFSCSLGPGVKFYSVREISQTQ